MGTIFNYLSLESANNTLNQFRIFYTVKVFRLIRHHFLFFSEAIELMEITCKIDMENVPQ